MAVAPRAFRLAHRVLGDSAEAEDAVAEALARALVAWSRIADKPWREGWVLRVTANVAIDAARRRRPAEIVFDDPVSGPDVAEALHVRAALRRLPRRQRQVLALRYFADLSDQQIAEALRISVGSIKKHAARGLAAMRTDLDPNSPEVSLAW